MLPVVVCSLFYHYTPAQVLHPCGDYPIVMSKLVVLKDVAKPRFQVLRSQIVQVIDNFCCQQLRYFAHTLLNHGKERSTMTSASFFGNRAGKKYRKVLHDFPVLTHHHCMCRHSLKPQAPTHISFYRCWEGKGLGNIPEPACVRINCPVLPTTTTTSCCSTPGPGLILPSTA